MSNYLDLVEEYPQFPKYTQFEKVLIAAKRAKSLHNDDRVPYVHDLISAGYTALAEYNQGILKPVYKDAGPEAVAQLETDGDDED